MSKQIIFNGKVVTREKVISKGYVTVSGGRIESVAEGSPDDAPDSMKIDAQGGWIAPGLVDIHLHGNGGFWGFFAADEIIKMANSLSLLGVTSFAPATVSLPHSQVIKSIGEMKKAMSKQAAGSDVSVIPGESFDTGARIIALNIEGPYINPVRPGAHLPPAIRNPIDKEIDEILAAVGENTPMLMTVAPEIEGGLALIDRLVAARALPSIGHSDATAEQTHEAIAHGANHFTHLFNAVRPFHQREPGCAFAALSDPGCSVEIILDNIHVHPDAAKVALAMKAPDKLVLVSDSIHAAGLPDGDYSVWGLKVTMKNNAVTLADGTFAGSALTLNNAVKNAIGLLGASPELAFRCASSNGLSKLGMAGEIGVLESGKIADIAIFDNDFNCMATMIAGQIVYKK
ncbi:MAG TPA: N-acetylglucosamine-6-phosphate deacetylase [bacterium]|nr:N-acetylglucosamine-6-phosphate deacetylase [bacterium]